MAYAIMELEPETTGSPIEQKEDDAAPVSDEELFECAFLLLDALMLTPVPLSDCPSTLDLQASDAEKLSRPA
jgi:hypothetical protein